MKPLSVGIVGCGVAGMATAALLSDAGCDVVVYERFAEPKPLGAGLLLQPTGMAVLKRLGVLDEARAAGAPVAGVDARTVSGRKVLDLSYADLGPGCAGLGIRRGALFSLLFERMRRSGARLATGVEVAGVEPHADGATVLGPAGPLESHDLVLVANGAHSALRAALGVERSAPVYPWGCAWATVADADGRFAGLLRQRLRSARVMVGALPVGPGVATLFWSLRVRDMEAWRAAGIESWRRDAADAWPELAPLLAQIDSMESMTLSTYRDVDVRPWSRGRIGVIGDAAHGTSPQLGQGANLALEDAATLADCLAEADDPEAALAILERRRRPRVDYYRSASRLLTPFYQSDSRILAWARDLAFGPACRVPFARRTMIETLAGVRRGWFAADRIGPDGLPAARG